MKAKIFLVLIAMTFHMGTAQALEYDSYSDEFQSIELSQFRIPLLNRGEGLLATSDVAIGTILTSHHFDNEDYNETHNGIYLSIDEWTLGTYKNSGNDQSNFVTYNSEIYRKHQLEVDLVIGLADGYGDWELARGEYLPILGFSTKWTYFKTMMSYDVVAFGLELPLN